MDCTVDDTLRYVLSLTELVEKGDVAAAALALLIEMGFQTSVEGFWLLRDSVVRKQQKRWLRCSEIYGEIGEFYGLSGIKAVDERIRNVLEAAWENRNEDTWGYFFSDKKTGALIKPSSAVFISHMACVLELWNRSCRKEVG